ncbi:MAG: response regulator [Gloeomargaritaceae cyanobacterium C42_A2020_066]|nr:response regulator [Gloeomargaritaceae cyanobacterium C42_A2020_066]
MKLLLVEDDASLVDLLRPALEAQHYVVDVCANGQDAWEMVQAYAYDLLILDVMLPGLDGISLCRRLRQEGYRQSILMLTAQGSDRERILGLDTGADDYVVKPFNLAELLARLRALARREGDSAPPVLSWGPLQLDLSLCMATYAGNPLALTPKEYQFLELFLRHRQRVLNRDFLLAQVWPADEVAGEETIRVHVKRLRQKLRAAGAPEDLVETVYGLGYRLRAAVLDRPSSQPQRVVVAGMPEAWRERWQTAGRPIEWVWCRQGRQVLESLMRPADVVVLGAMVSQPGPVEVVRQIRDVRNQIRLPILAYLTSPTQRQSIAAWGVAAFVPVRNPDLVLSQVESVLEGTDPAGLVAIAQVWAGQQERMQARLDILQGMVQALTAPSSDPWDATLHLKAIQVAHALAGSLGTFGLVHASHLAQELEGLLLADTPPGVEVRPKILTLIEEITEQIDLGRPLSSLK